MSHRAPDSVMDTSQADVDVADDDAVGTGEEAVDEVMEEAEEGYSKASLRPDNCLYGN